MLAECNITPASMLLALNSTVTEYSYSPGICKRIAIFTRFDGQLLPPIRETDKVTIRHLRTFSGDLTLVAAHLMSKLYNSDSSQGFECSVLAQMIRDVERQAGHSRTILVGDLNMNPFEPGMVAANGLHAVMTRHIASEQNRVVQGESYPFFYNPMWGYFGDIHNTHAGTFYYRRPEHVVYFWNMFDQVLVRPDLLPFFPEDSVQILSTDGNQSFVKNSGIPDDKEGFDHLPVLFRLNM